jgi:hypothetical protein
MVINDSPSEPLAHDFHAHWPWEMSRKPFRYAWTVTDRFEAGDRESAKWIFECTWRNAVIVRGMHYFLFDRWADRVPSRLSDHCRTLRLDRNMAVHRSIPGLML